MKQEACCCAGDILGHEVSLIAMTVSGNLGAHAA